MMPEILGVKFGPSGSNVLVLSASSKLFSSAIKSNIVSVWSPFVTIVTPFTTLTGA